jgi:hypothetical protein
MKRITAVLLTLFIATTLGACSGAIFEKETSVPAPTQPKESESSKEYVTFANLDTRFYSLEREENGEWPACEFIADITQEKTIQRSDGEKVIRAESQFSYALCGKEKVNILVTPVKLVIGNQTKVFREDSSATGTDDGWVEDFPDIGIVDLDESDQYKEIVLMNHLGNGYVETTIYRFDGRHIIEIVGFGAYKPIYVNHKGKIVGAECYLDITDPLIALSYFQCKDNRLEEIALDKSKILGKQHVYRSPNEWDDRIVNFFETSTAPNISYSNTGKDEEYFSPDADYVSSLPDNMRSKKGQHQFRQGETFTLLKMSHERVSNYGAWYYVQLEDGRRGVIYWFLAG